MLKGPVNPLHGQLGEETKLAHGSLLPFTVTKPVTNRKASKETDPSGHKSASGEVSVPGNRPEYARITNLD